MLDRSAENAFAAVLGAHQLRAYISDNPHYCGSFAEPERACAHGMFHLIDEGSCVVDFARGGGSIDLNSGDLVMFPHGAGHTLRSPPDSNAGPAANRFTSILCGEFEFATGRRNPILDALPDWIVVREADSQQQFRHLARLMAHEARQESFGRQLVLDGRPVAVRAAFALGGKFDTLIRKRETAGIMLPNHSPLTIAEQFGTLATLFPGRIDLGRVDRGWVLFGRIFPGRVEDVDDLDDRVVGPVMDPGRVIVPQRFIPSAFSGPASRRS